jgi:hypothetical protein
VPSTSDEIIDLPDESGPRVRGWSSGEPITAARLNEAVDAIERMREGTPFPIQARPRIGRGTTGNARRFRLKSVHGDYIVARTWDGTTEGSEDVKLAKPWLLRRSPFEEGGAHDDRDGASFYYITDSERIVQDADGWPTFEMVEPPYLADDEINTVGTVIGGTGVEVGGEKLRRMDRNIDARRWGTFSRGAFVMGGQQAQGDYISQTDNFLLGVWTTRRDIPPPSREESTAFTLGLSAYLCYGHVEATGGSAWTNDVERYWRETWLSAPTAPTPQRDRSSGGTIRGFGYVLGGFREDGSTVYARELIEEFRPGHAQAWATLDERMVQPRGDHASASANDMIYSFCGTADSRLTHVEAFDGDYTRSQTAAPAPAREFLAATAVGSLCYIFGGRDSGGLLADVDVFDPSDDAGGSWSGSPLLSLGTAIEGMCAFSMGGAAYIVGGQDASSRVTTVQKYDVGGNSWSTDTALPTPARRAAEATTIPAVM